MKPTYAQLETELAETKAELAETKKMLFESTELLKRVLDNLRVEADPPDKLVREVGPPQSHPLVQRTVS